LHFAVPPVPVAAGRAFPTDGARRNTLPQRLIRKAAAFAIRTARLLIARGHLLRAFVFLRNTYLILPNSVSGRLLFARVAVWLGHDQCAIDALSDAALACDPEARASCRRIAQLFLDLDEYDKAFTYATVALSTNPSAPHLWELLGQVYERQRKVDDAATCFIHQSRLESGVKAKVSAIAKAADLMASSGRGEAAMLYESLLAIDPTFTAAYYELAEIRRPTSLVDPLVVSMQRHLLRSPSARNGRQHLHYALGAVYDRCGDAGAAFAHFMLANQSRRQICRNDSVAALRSGAEERCRVFTRKMMVSKAYSDQHTPLLVCIVGMPRSGTTLVSQLLAQHPRVAALGERDDFFRLSGGLHQLLRTSLRYPGCCNDMRPRDVAMLSETIRDRLRRAAGPCDRIVTKLPGDYMDLGLIHILFPSAKIVHCVRDPVDTCMSCFMQNFEALSYATDLDELAEVYRIYATMMDHWKATLPASAMVHLSYEALVRESQTVVRGLFEFLELSFDDDVLQFFADRTPVATMSRWQVRRPIYQTSVNRSAQYSEFIAALLSLRGSARASCK
jgi:tetratricopeptide (TPR) repeat protein